VSVFRQTVRDTLYAHLVAFKAANPTMVTGDVYRARPGSFVAPCIYIGGLSEPRIVQSGGAGSGVRSRQMRPTIVIVTRLIVPDETSQAEDDLVDAFLDYMDANEHIAGGIIATESTQDTELTLEGTVYSATVITCRAEVAEGRS